MVIKPFVSVNVLWLGTITASAIPASDQFFYFPISQWRTYYYCLKILQCSYCDWKLFFCEWIFQVKRTLGQFTPAYWDKDEWHPLLGPWRFLQVLSLCVVFLTVELNTFFLKFCLWVPPRNPLIIYRLILWWLIAIPTIREYNTYLQDRYFFSLYSHT